MDTSGLSDYQLYEIIQNKKLHTHIRIIANKEFNKRNLTISELRDIVMRHESLVNEENDKSLSWQYKLLLILCPFFLAAVSVISSRFLANGDHRKWKSYWLYVSIGYFIWTVALLTVSKFLLFRQ